MGSAHWSRLRERFHEWHRRPFDRGRLPCEWQWLGGSGSSQIPGRHSFRPNEMTHPESKNENSYQEQGTSERLFPYLPQPVLRSTVLQEQSAPAGPGFSRNPELTRGRLGCASVGGRSWLFCLAPRFSSFSQFLDVQHHLHTALIALAGIFRHSSRNDVIESRRQLRIENSHRYRVVVDHLERDRDSAVALKRPVACQEVVQDHT